jgi:hypothetical protein
MSAWQAPSSDRHLGDRDEGRSARLRSGNDRAAKCVAAVAVFVVVGAFAVAPGTRF